MMNELPRAHQASDDDFLDALFGDDFEAILRAAGVSSLDGSRRRQVSLGVVPTDFSRPGYVSTLDLERAYGEQFQDDAMLTVQIQVPPRELRVDLDCLAGLTKDALLALRRRLAIANHPDLVASQHREEATKRMSRINELIDIALATASANGN